MLGHSPRRSCDCIGPALVAAALLCAACGGRRLEAGDHARSAAPRRARAAPAGVTGPATPVAQGDVAPVCLPGRPAPALSLRPDPDQPRPEPDRLQADDPEARRGGLHHALSSGPDLHGRQEAGGRHPASAPRRVADARPGDLRRRRGEDHHAVPARLRLPLRAQGRVGPQLHAAQPDAGSPRRCTSSWDVDFVPDGRAAATGIKEVSPLWLDVGAGNYPVFDALRGSGQHGRYTVPRRRPRRRATEDRRSRSTSRRRPT